MKKFTRRNLIKGGAAAGVAAGTYSPLSRAALLVPTYRSSRKAVVIGSGFGGSVASLRLAEAGIPTMLIERGKHWVYQGEDSYPTVGGFIGDIDDGLLWKEPGPISGSTGMLEQYIGGSIPVGVGAGLGGGSLVYGGVLLQPPRELFEKVLPNISYDEMDSIYYPRLLSRVSGGKIPDDILNSPNYTSMRVFIENANLAGLDVVRSEVGFDWDVIRKEVQGEITPFASIGEYVLGCNSGAKKTLDRNYLADAQNTGNLEIMTLHNVVRVRKKIFSSRYEVHCDVVSEDGEVIAKRIIDCKYLFMAAGSIHTTRLLLKAKALGDIPTINEGVGQEWGTNGDELKARNNITASTGPVQGGPPAIAAFDFDNPVKPTGFMHSPNLVAGEYMQMQMGMCIPDQTSTASYNVVTDKINFNWSREDNEPSTSALNHTMDKMMNKGGGELLDVKALGTWHPLGGAAMGVACSDLGELYGTPNLFVVDGALIPGSSGAANPSLTIGANAERIMERLVAQLT
ncbi:GMC family oxidoreductase [Parahaliea maris]|uniref:Cholesterol oxidase n=1 Tax=Parahaliea maris TaxID=2716870 RepID=A0A5C8ZTK2_9GAMM|nr:GMC family oxidoreductase N-terminal domain-containing protein [Parahaliea maris]TXS90787.1 GMC family oxidoreductase [Parahaliea maris]